MKATARSISFIAAALLIAAVPVLAEENGMGQQMPQVQKNECLLVAKNCPTESIQERINDLTNEINRGAAVYNEDELRKLKNELNFYKQDIKLLEKDETPVIGS